MNTSTTLLILQVFVAIASALHCYECDSRYEGENCVSPLNKTTVLSTDCLHSRFISYNSPYLGYQYQCVAYVKRSQNTNYKYVQRGCAVVGNYDYCDEIRRKYKGDAVDDCYVCGENSCNSGSRITATLINLALISILIKL